MVARKKTAISRSKVEPAFDDLYISMHSPNEKRKNLLYGLKNSLIMQDEFEKILDIRREKSSLLKNIKSNMNNLNDDYQKLKKLLPNVKNVLSFTQKELNELDLQIETLRGSIKNEREQIFQNESLKESLENKPELKPKLDILKKQEIKEVISKEKIEVKKDSDSHKTKKETHEPLSKLDRIKNNLKVIESKLNQI